MSAIEGKRIAALEAVAEAAAVLEFIVNDDHFDTQDGADAFEAMEDALRTLRSLPAEPAAEGVG